MDPSEFGRAARPKWINPDTDRERVLKSAAIAQHRIARKIRAYIVAQSGDRARSINELARDLGVYRDTINSVLNGKTHAALPMLALLADRLGVDLKVDLEA